MTRDQLLFRIYTGIILLIVLIAICAPLLSPYDPYESAIQNSLLPPSAEHYFGTDKLGRDIFTRILYRRRMLAQNSKRTKYGGQNISGNTNLVEYS